MKRLWFAHAVYTGGNIWLFYGKFKNGDFFLMDDDGDILILDADPSDFDESLYTEWQESHLKAELTEPWVRRHYQEEILDMVARSCDGGFTESDKEAYLNYFHDIDENERHAHMAEVLVQMAKDEWLDNEDYDDIPDLALQLEALDHSSSLWYTLEAIADKYESEVM